MVLAATNVSALKFVFLRAMDEVDLAGLELSIPGLKGEVKVYLQCWLEGFNTSTWSTSCSVNRLSGVKMQDFSEQKKKTRLIMNVCAHRGAQSTMKAPSSYLYPLKGVFSFCLQPWFFVPFYDVLVCPMLRYRTSTQVLCAFGNSSNSFLFFS